MVIPLEISSVSNDPPSGEGNMVSNTHYIITFLILMLYLYADLKNLVVFWLACLRWINLSKNHQVFSYHHSSPLQHSDPYWSSILNHQDPEWSVRRWDKQRRPTWGPRGVSSHGYEEEEPLRKEYSIKKGWWKNRNKEAETPNMSIENELRGARRSF